MGPTWVLSAQDGLHVGPTNLAIREYIVIFTTYQHWISWLLGSFFLEDKNHWSMTAHVLATHITMTSYERHVVSNHRPFDCLFNGLCGPSSNKHQSPHYWPVNSPHQGPVTRKKASIWWRHHEELWKKLLFDLHHYTYTTLVFVSDWKWKHVVLLYL